MDYLSNENPVPNPLFDLVSYTCNVVTFDFEIWRNDGCFWLYSYSLGDFNIDMIFGVSITYSMASLLLNQNYEKTFENSKTKIR